MARMSADERRAQLVEAAIVVMTRDGIAKATTRAIVGEAGVPLGVFHYCFESKAAVLERVVTTLHERSVERVLTTPPTSGSVRDIVRATLEEYWQHVVTHRDEHRLTYEVTQAALHDPALAGVARAQYELYLHTNTEALTSAADRIGVTFTVPVRELSRYLLSVLDGLTLNWLLLGDDTTAAAVLDLASDHVAALTVPT